MKRIYPFFLVLFSLIVLLGMGGCQDTCEQTFTYTFYEPVTLSKKEFYASARVQAPQPLGKPGKIYIKDKYLFINELNKGIHVFDNRNPSAPRAISFINIPGNVDLAVKGNILYADSKMDLLAIDISNPEEVKITKRITNIFPGTQYNPGRFQSGVFSLDTGKVIVEWNKKEEKQVSGCDNFQQGWFPRGGGVWFAEDSRAFTNSASNSSGPASFSGGSGKGGSMARFAVVKNLLYTVDQSMLRLFDVTKAENPVSTKQMGIGWGVETIFPYGQHLFFGTTSGMLIYNISNPENPVFTSSTSHFVGCDPVAVEGDYAYITVKGGTSCRSSWPSQLEVVDISTITKPVTIKTYPMEDPNGLGVDGKALFVCDGKAGLKIYDLADRTALDKNLIGAKNIHSYDVIPFNNIAIVVGNDGLYQYDYTDPKNLKLLSVINLVAN